MPGPVRLEAHARRLVTDILPGLDNPKTAVLRAGRGRRTPVPALLVQGIVAEASEQDVKWGRMLRMELEAIALEPLREIRRPGVRVDRVDGGADRQAEYRQSAVLLPILAETATDTQVGLREAALGCLGHDRMRGGK